jgi:hypothetical protein
MKSFILLLESINNKFLIYFVHYIQQKKNNIVWTFFKQLKKHCMWTKSYNKIWNNKLFNFKGIDILIGGKFSEKIMLYLRG